MDNSQWPILFQLLQSILAKIGAGGGPAANVNICPVACTVPVLDATLNATINGLIQDCTYQVLSPGCGCVGFSYPNAGTGIFSIVASPGIFATPTLDPGEGLTAGCVYNVQVTLPVPGQLSTLEIYDQDNITLLSPGQIVFTGGVYNFPITAASNNISFYNSDLFGTNLNLSVTLTCTPQYITVTDTTLLTSLSQCSISNISDALRTYLYSTTCSSSVADILCTMGSYAYGNYVDRATSSDFTYNGDGTLASASYTCTEAVYTKTYTYNGSGQLTNIALVIT